MASRKSGRSKIVAKLVTGPKAPCAFCQRIADDEITYGKLYAIGDIQCHYFCVLLSSCLIQKGRDEDGLFGFLYTDIIAEVDRCTKHRCSYCSRFGANLGCAVVQCKKQFHLPCGRQRNAVSLFYGNYKTFCEAHAPKQSVPDNIMCKAKLRMAGDKKMKRKSMNKSSLKQLSSNGDESYNEKESVCVICYEAVKGYPTTETFWPPCCARDAWFHRNCLQRMALSAGVHYLKCPLCNDKDHFYEAVITQGYYVPDRDAAWELEQNAYSEIYERPVACSEMDCSCPMGRSHDDDDGLWSIRLCMLCGSSGAHSRCVRETTHHVCAVCQPAAPSDLDQLATTIEKVIISEEERQINARPRHGPIMPSRMSLRRTKRNANPLHAPSCSTTTNGNVKVEDSSTTLNTKSSREELNLKTPKRQTLGASTPQTHKELLHSPTKMLEDCLKTKTASDVIDDTTAEKLRCIFRKPKPLSMKKKIVNDIISGLFDNMLEEPKQKDAVKQWCSPKKSSDIKQEVLEDDTSPPAPNKSKSSKKSPTFDANIEPKTEQNSDTCSSIFGLPPELIAETNSLPIFDTPKKLKTIEILNDSSLEISNADQTVNINVFKMASAHKGGIFKELVKSPPKSNMCSLKFNRFDKEVLDSEVDIDMESFTHHYLNEVSRKEKRMEKKKKYVKRLREKRKRDAKEKIVLRYESPGKSKEKNMSISNKDIKVKIKWHREQLKLKITDSKRKKTNYKQYVLNYSSEDKTERAKPDVEFTPKRRKYVKQNKTPEGLVQTSIKTYFKVKPAKD